jgi:hypothetical protein
LCVYLVFIFKKICEKGGFSALFAWQVCMFALPYALDYAIACIGNHNFAAFAVY